MHRFASFHLTGQKLLGLKRPLALIMSFFLLVSMNPALAHGADGSGGADVVNTGARIPHRTLRRGAELDLSSAAANISLGSNLFRRHSSITVNVARVEPSFIAGSYVTAAQFVAIKQVMKGGSQALVLNDQGAASGGSFTLNSVASARVSELIVPTGVTAVGEFSRNSRLGFAGDLVNFGSIYGVSTNRRADSGTIFAQNITNGVGAVISTQLSSDMLSKLPDAVSSLSLTLSAANNITNAGLISSSGNLTLSAGGSIINALPSGVQAAAPVIQAVNNINLLTGSGVITNAGLIASQAANIYMASLTALTDININGIAGSFQALAGNINVRDALYSGLADINLIGGDYLSKALNLYSGEGSVEVNVGQVTGVVNTQAGVDRFTAATDNLVLGNHCITGDPTYYNTGGSITIAGNISVNEALGII